MLIILPFIAALRQCRYAVAVKRGAIGLVLAWAVLAVAPNAATAAEDLGIFIDRIITAHGGVKALSSASTLRQTGRTVSAKRGEAVGVIERTLQRPDRLRVEISFPGEETEVRILNGSEGWTQGVEASLPLRAAMRLQAARIGLPLVLLAAKENLINRGGATGKKGEALRVIELPLGPHTAMIVEVDIDSARIRRSRGFLSFGKNAMMEFATTYDRFRKWNGILFASHEEQYVMGQHISYTLIDAVVILDSVAPQTFQP